MPKKVLFSLLPLLLIGATFEFFFRCYPIHRDSGKTVAGIVIPDENLIWRLAPYQDGPLATNDLGLRDTPYNPLAERKILLLGDSVSWGHGIQDIKQTYPYIAERILTEASSKTYEIINSSVPGYVTFQELRYLKLHGLKLKPDMIVLQFCLNDVVERYSSMAQYGGDNIFLGVDTRHAVKGVFGWLLVNSRAFEAAYRYTVTLARNRQEYEVTRMAEDVLSRELSSAWEDTLSDIDEIRRTAAENHIRFMIVIAPYSFQLHDPLKMNQPQNQLIKWGEKTGVRILDLLPYFASLHQRSKIPLFLDSSHFSIHGHAHAAMIVAQGIADAFED